jgi:hypothetical protein
MFNFFKKKQSTNVVSFPERTVVPKMPKVEPPQKPEKPATVFYRFGVTDNNRLAFQMGYSEITLNKQGIEDLIDQLTFFKDQLVDDEEA